MNVGIFALYDILDDGVKRRFTKVVSINAAADMTEGIERSGVGDNYVIAILQAKSHPSGFGQRGFIVCDEIARYLI